MDCVAVWSDGSERARVAQTGGSTLRRLVVVCAVLTALQLLFHTGPTASDDFIYLRLAHEARGVMPAVGASHMYARLAASLPLRVCVLLFGPNTGALLPIPLLTAIGTTLAVWLFVRRHFGEPTAWVAAWAMGLSPMFLVYATIWHPDSLAGLWLMVAMIALAPAVLDPSCRRPAIRALIGGFLIGVAYSAKETAVLAGPGVALFILLFRCRCGWAWRRLALAAVGGMAFVGVETLALWAMTGDPLFRIHAITQSQHAYGAPAAVAAPRYYLSEYVRWLANPSGAFGWWGAAYLIATIAAPLKATDPSRLVLCVIGVMFAYLTAGTTDPTAYFPVHHQPRYLLVLMPLGTVLLAHAFVRLRGIGTDRSNHARWFGMLNGRVIAAAAAGALLVDTVQHANANAGKPYAAATYAAGQKLFDSRGHPWPADARVCASPGTAFRLWPLVERSGHTPIERVLQPPASAAGWLRNYEGAYVLVSHRDRAPFDKALNILGAQSLEALTSFPLTITVYPARTRLGSLAARLGLSTFDPAREYRIDVHHVTAKGLGGG